MPLVDGKPMCDACGRPATSMARDMVRHVHPSLQFEEFSPATGRVKMGCDEHPVESVEYVSRSLSPWRKK